MTRLYILLVALTIGCEMERIAACGNACRQADSKMVSYTDGKCICTVTPPPCLVVEPASSTK